MAYLVLSARLSLLEPLPLAQYRLSTNRFKLRQPPPLLVWSGYQNRFKLKQIDKTRSDLKDKITNSKPITASAEKLSSVVPSVA